MKLKWNPLLFQLSLPHFFDRNHAEFALNHCLEVSPAPIRNGRFSRVPGVAISAISWAVDLELLSRSDLDVINKTYPDEIESEALLGLLGLLKELYHA